MRTVLDACAMIAFLRGEPGADVVEAALLAKDRSCLAHAINVCEVFYDFLRASGEQTARRALADCFAITLASQQQSDLLTSDRREFAPIEKAGVCSVRFIR